MRSIFMVMSAVLRPMRAAAIAASQPAWPAPTTATSYCSVNAIYCNSTCRRFALAVGGEARDGAVPLAAFPKNCPKRLVSAPNPAATTYLAHQNWTEGGGMKNLDR